MNKGQSLIELLAAIAIFVLVLSAVGFLLIRGSQAGTQARHYSKAVFLAQEGMEAAQSIRDNNWNDLWAGSHGLAISSSHWVLQGIEQDISLHLPQGIRKLVIENTGPNRKKIISRILWQNAQEQQNQVELITYLTNWAKPLPPYLAQLHYRWRNDNGGE